MSVTGDLEIASEVLVLLHTNMLLADAGSCHSVAQGTVLCVHNPTCLTLLVIVAHTDISFQDTPQTE
jgi:hypothetical protein